MKTYVYVTHRFVAFHRWQNAPEERAYLKHPHRHLFHVKACVNVNPVGDRDVEFHDLLELVKDRCSRFESAGASPWPFSCESFAEMIGSYLIERGLILKSVEVSEDGENGAIVEW